MNFETAATFVSIFVLSGLLITLEVLLFKDRSLFSLVKALFQESPLAVKEKESTIKAPSGLET